MPMVMWGLMPSLKWTLRPVTCPGGSWPSGMWLLRQGSASTQVCRVCGGCEWRGLGLGSCRAVSNSSATRRTEKVYKPLPPCMLPLQGEVRCLAGVGWGLGAPYNRHRSLPKTGRERTPCHPVPGTSCPLPCYNPSDE